MGCNWAHAIYNSRKAVLEKQAHELIGPKCQQLLNTIRCKASPRAVQPPTILQWRVGILREHYHRSQGVPTIRFAAWHELHAERTYLGSWGPRVICNNSCVRSAGVHHLRLIWQLLNSMRPVPQRIPGSPPRRPAVKERPSLSTSAAAGNRVCTFHMRDSRFRSTYMHGNWSPRSIALESEMILCATCVNPWPPCDVSLTAWSDMSSDAFVITRACRQVAWS